MKRRICILGGGISGLSLAWHLQQYPEQFAITLLEANSEAGGWLASQVHGGFFFEKGPRIFKTSRSEPLLELIHNLQLQDQLIGADESAHKRYLWIDGRLQAFPWPLCKFSILKALIREPWIAAKQGDESIFDFAVRRFGKEMAESFFDPLVLGVYGGDMHQLSIQSCFPFFKKLEDQYGSVCKGMFFQKKQTSKQFPYSSRFFSLKGGCKQLIDALVSSLKPCIRLQERVKEIAFSSEEVKIVTEKGQYLADVLISALPAEELSKLLLPHDATIAEKFASIPMQSLQLAYLGYQANCLKWRGFGYLVPTKEKEEVLGAVFDSNVFPMQNQHTMETRITYMIRDCGQSEEETAKIALRAVEKHLKIQEIPSVLGVLTARAALPQYRVGHAEFMEKLQKEVNTRFPYLHFTGNYLAGASVSDCILQSIKLGETLAVPVEPPQVAD